MNRGPTRPDPWMSHAVSELTSLTLAAALTRESPASDLMGKFAREAQELLRGMRA